MRNDDSRRKKLRDGVARARILLKQNLGWLPGYPLKVNAGKVHWRHVPWESPGSFEERTLDRESIRRMEMTVSKLRHNFPRALPKVVPDVDGWLRRMDFFLAWLKTAVHQESSVELNPVKFPDNAPLPERWVKRSQEIVRTQPLLSSLVEAIGFLELTSRGEPDLQRLDWIVEHAVSLSQCDLTTQLAITLMRHDCDAKAREHFFQAMRSPPTELYSIEGVYGLPNRLSQELSKAIDLKPFEIPSDGQRTPLSEPFAEFLSWLVQQKPRRRRSASQLFATVQAPDFFERAVKACAHAKSEAARLEHWLREIQAGEPVTYRTKHEKRRLKKRAVVSVPDVSIVFAIGQLAPTLKTIQSLGHEEADAIARVLSSLPAELDDTRIKLLGSWISTDRHPQRIASRRPFLLAELGKLFTRRGVHAAIKRNLLDFGKSERRWDRDFVWEVLWEDAGVEVYKRFVALLEIAYYDGDATDSDDFLCSLVDFARSTKDLARIGRLIQQLVEAGAAEDFYVDDDIRTALRICCDDDTDIGKVLVALDEHEELSTNGKIVRDHLYNARLRRIVRNAVLAADKKTLSRIASFVSLYAANDLKLPDPSALENPSDWLGQYPIELHAVLFELNGVTSDAPRIAAKVLSKEFPSRQGVLKQIEVLEEKIARNQYRSADESLRQGLNNLRAKLDRPTRVSPARLANLRQKLQARADLEFVEIGCKEWYQGIQHTLVTQAAGFRLDESLFEPPNDQIVSAILQLKGRTKQLGIRVLDAWANDRNCDFRQEPANQKFLQRQQALGIRTEPWLDPEFVVHAKTNRGEPYELRFTRDIRDYLLMGFYFNTCLSPGSFNFFSTIANAIDVNKQVVFGKCTDGRMIGRCLFALTDEGRLLTYHRYAHNTDDRFEDAVEEFAKRLVREMRTDVASRGRPPRLESAQWYDDGVVALSSDDEIITRAEVRKILGSSNVATIIPKLQEHYRSVAEVRRQLRELLSYDEFQMRPEIIQPFTFEFGLRRQVRFADRIRIALLAQQANFRQESHSVLDSLKPNTLPQRLRRLPCRDYQYYPGIGQSSELFDLLTDYSPTLALRFIRLTRTSGIRSDLDESNRARVTALASIHRLLGRNELAKKLAQRRTAHRTTP